MKTPNGSTNCYGHWNVGSTWNGMTNRLENGDGGEKEFAEMKDGKWNTDDLTEPECNITEKKESEDGECELDPCKEVQFGSWTDPLFSNVLIRKPEGTNPDRDSTNEYESNPDDSEEDFNPDMIFSPVGIEKAVSDAREEPDLQKDRYSYW